ncbi:hypothetical protein J3454_03695 [Erythrobacter sp. NFXS35]|uniref:hypothetical protein n=1 Tax=Erythrobacter sp. NFXS35 TaxID=2818436 RepID=UPI0032DEC2F9
MSFWTAAVIIVAIWGFVTIWSRRHDRDLGVTRDEDGNPIFAPRDDNRSAAELEAAHHELEDLRERIKVLERIATDSNNSDARERARISAEIEALRGLPNAKEDKSE